MKAIRAFITEKLKISNKVLDGPIFADFICWYFGLTDISEFTFEEFEMVDFDPESLDENFDGDMKAQYEFIMEHIDDPIGKINITNPYGDFEHTFVIGNIPFTVVCDEEFKNKN